MLIGGCSLRGLYRAPGKGARDPIKGDLDLLQGSLGLLYLRGFTPFIQGFRALLKCVGLTQGRLGSNWSYLETSGT